MSIIMKQVILNSSHSFKKALRIFFVWSSLCITVIDLAAQAGKIKLTKPGQGTTANAPAQGENYTTAQGPESFRRTLYMGPSGGLNINGLTANSDGWDASPIMGLRSELFFNRVYGAVLDLGYEQNRYFVSETEIAGLSQKGIIRSDSLYVRPFFSYRYSMYKALAKVKLFRPIADTFRPVAGNLQVGGNMKVNLSSQLEVTDSQLFYDLAANTNVFSFGVMAGLGFELRVTQFIVFLETAYFRGLTNTYNPLESRLFNTAAMAEHGVLITMGVKTGVWGF